jgi:hypothetical protein
MDEQEAVEFLLGAVGDTDPDRISFTRSLRVTRRRVHYQAEFPPAASPPPSSARSLNSCNDCSRRVGTRSNPRVIKRKVSAGPSTRPPLRTDDPTDLVFTHHRGHQAQERETDTELPVLGLTGQSPGAGATESRSWHEGHQRMQRPVADPRISVVGVELRIRRCRDSRRLRTVT